ncbi:MAG: hypothetical protein C0622_11815 [Desulfuromonas sp.]|nr:MAG: hypothetical protein C0622_11815 [Desulfuromonas sp.]
MNEVAEHDHFHAVLFDLDGTLLQAQMTEFIPRYVHALASYCADKIDPQRFEKSLLHGIRRLINIEGDGRHTNEERLYIILADELGMAPELLQESLAYFEQNGLEDLHELIHPVPAAQQIVAACNAHDIPLVLATNPVFPRFMIDARMRWAGLEASSFTHVTSYENSRYCKPQLGYFRDIAELLGLEPEQCLMVGNDLSHDLAAVGVGMTAYLVDTWLVEREGPSWPCEYRGDHAALRRFLAEHVC